MVKNKGLALKKSGPLCHTLAIVYCIFAENIEI